MISIIIPIYNVEKYISRCLLSVMNQENISKLECLLIDDCGNDSSMNIAESLVSSYKGNFSFKIIRHKKNRGLSAARNTGIINASGEYVYFLDSDDEILPDSISLFERYINLHPNVDCVVGDVYASYPYSKWIRVKSAKEFFVEGNKEIQQMLLKRNPVPVTAWNKAVRKGLIIENSLFFQEGLIHEDEIWSFQISRYLKSYGYLNQATYIYFQNSNSIVTNQIRSLKHKVRILDLFSRDLYKSDIYLRYRFIGEWILDIYKNIGLLDKQEREEIEINKINIIARQFLKSVIHRKYFNIAAILLPNMYGVKLNNNYYKFIILASQKILRLL